MEAQSIYNSRCPVSKALNVLGGKWRLPILSKLSHSNLRYNELRRQLKGITNIMLTRSLKELEEYNLVNRIQYSEIPLHVEYSLSEQGKQLIPALLIIKDWGEKMTDKQY